MAGTTLPTPLYGLYQEEIGFSELIVTVVFAVYAFGVIGVLLLAGNISDTVGRRPVLLCGLVLAALSAVCFLAESGLPLLFLGRFLSGLSAGLFTGAATAFVMECAPPGKEGRAAFASTAANMGGLGCGPLLAGVLAEYAPWPLKLPFLVHLALVAVSFAVLWFLPETVREPKPLRVVRPQWPSLPPQVRALFVPAGLAAFVGFSLLGVFTSVSPAFLAQSLGVENHAVVGLIVFLAFFASTVGQLLVPRLGVARALPAGCFTLVAGLALLAGALAWDLLALVVLSALVGGAGQGLALRGAVASVASAAPEEHRAGVISSLFVVAYTGISIPVIGIGVLAEPLGLEDAGLVFICCMVLLAGSAGIYLLRRPADLARV
ncbi:MFS transporter [Streptomyces sp. NBC_01167]|uniref:MFS transporter n=1 Tax=Streptomyces sp. NBC_01167 TaxID=2903756 RepID=UPI0038638EBB|nr:MFS transporter [Streptomyces sp. NBC_01167]